MVGFALNAAADLTRALVEREYVQLIGVPIALTVLI